LHAGTEYCKKPAVFRHKLGQALLWLLQAGYSTYLNEFHRAKLPRTVTVTNGEETMLSYHGMAGFPNHLNIESHQREYLDDLAPIHA
jgi:hypothetical protein